jgi:hypothetical protein
MKLKFVSENDTRDDHTPMDGSGSRIAAHFTGTGIYIYIGKKWRINRNIL